MSRRKTTHEPCQPEPFRLVVTRASIVLAERTAMIARDPVGGLPMTRSKANELAAQFGAPAPTTAYALGMDEAVWRIGDGPYALWIIFTAV